MTDIYSILRGSGYVTNSQAGELEDEILNYFESRTCESCKFCYSAPERHLVKCKMWGIMVRDEMMCNRWEAKEKR